MPQQPRKRTAIVLIDDHPMVLEGISSLINKSNDLWVCGQAGDIATARAIIETAKPALIIMDLALGNESGLDAIKAFCVERPALPILVFSMYDEQLFAERALRNGAKGYVMKQNPPSCSSPRSARC